MSPRFLLFPLLFAICPAYFAAQTNNPIAPVKFADVRITDRFWQPRIDRVATVTAYTLSNSNGMRVKILDYGGIVTSLVVPDRDGRPGDVVLGYDSLGGYRPHPGFPYFGCLVGRYANRIAGARFALDGRTYSLAPNNDGNSLHGGLQGFDKQMWRAETAVHETGATLTLTLRSPDGEEGYPGNLDVKVTYTVTAANELRIDYEAATDQPVPVNLTNHLYFNLSAGQSPAVLDHRLTLRASRYTLVDAQLIPTGRLEPVGGTPMDFTGGKQIGQEIARVPGGYDHNFVLDGWTGSGAPFFAARLDDPASGRSMTMLTTEPGVQFYSGNFLDGTLRGKGGVVYGRHAGLCLEAQHFSGFAQPTEFPGHDFAPGRNLPANYSLPFFNQMRL